MAFGVKKARMEPWYVVKTLTTCTIIWTVYQHLTDGRTDGQTSQIKIARQSADERQNVQILP